MTIEDIRSATGMANLAALFGISNKKFAYYVYGISAERKYHKFSILKKNGDTREILSPIFGLKKIQSELNACFVDNYRVHECVHGFVKNRCVATNALCHERSNAVLNIDLLDFFGSINFGRVLGLFRSGCFKFSCETAKILAQICCFENKLPQGAPTSPVISNYICWNLDNALCRAASRYGCVYTRYADDITISSMGKMHNSIVNGMGEIGIELKSAIDANGFRINESKTKFVQFSSRRKEVTGLVVNNRVNVKREYLRNLRAIIHNYNSFGRDAAENKYNDLHRGYRRQERNNLDIDKVIQGKLSFLSMVKGFQDRQYIKYLAKYSAGVIQPTGLPERKEDYLQREEDGAFVVESENEQGTGFFINHCRYMITCAHVAEYVGNGVCIVRANNPNCRYSGRVVYVSESEDVAFILVDKITRRYNFDCFSARIERSMRIKMIGNPSWNKGSSVVEEKGEVKGHFLCNKYQTIRYATSFIIAGGASGSPIVLEGGRNSGKIVGMATSGPANDADVIRDQAKGFSPSTSGFMSIEVILSELEKCQAYLQSQ